jgi:peptide/nickel transport system substrate-binding protein
MHFGAIRCLGRPRPGAFGGWAAILRAAVIFASFASVPAQADMDHCRTIAGRADSEPPVLLAALDDSQADAPQYAIAMHGAPALAENYTHFAYGNPAAPKGGRLTIGLLGTFDSLNPFNIKSGSAAQGLDANVFQTLMARSFDEPFTLYGLIAKSIETNEARSYVLFRLDPRAKFSDGTPITSADIAFTFSLLKEKGRPQQRAAYTLVKRVEVPDAETIRFDFPGVDDRELPLILALMPVLSRRVTDVANFEQASFAIPVGSGPYRIAEVDPGEKLILRRNPAYWAKDLPSQRGFFNFDEIEIDYYRDANSLFEAFQAGLVDFRVETDPLRWTTGYNFPAAREHRVVCESLPVGGPKGMDGFVFNLRRGLFDDVRVREALGMMFDFEWVNANLFAGQYTRTKSFFDDSEFASTGRPASAAERVLLTPFPGAVREDIMEGRWRPPRTDGTGHDRIWPKRALDLLASAGCQIVDGRLRKDGKPFNFEIMVEDRAQERLALNYAHSLARIGVEARVRLVDEVQYQRRRQNFDFDMMIGSWPASASPGSEQRTRWGSAAADEPDSYNLAGVKSPAVDAMIEAVLAAKSRRDFVTAVRALDRVLLSGFYIVPLFYSREQWIAASTALERPAKLPAYGSPTIDPTLDAWWRKP